MSITYLGNNSVILEQGSPVSYLIINREEKRNALNQDVIQGLFDGIKFLEKDDKTRLIAIRGQGEKAFCAGADLSSSDLVGAKATDAVIDEHAGRKNLASLFLNMWSCSKPIVAVVKGYAMAGGFGLACSCDMIYASNDAIFSASEVRVGLWPFMITVPILKSLSPKKAFELMVTAKRITAQEAFDLGIVNKVVESDKLFEAVKELGEQIRQGSPSAIALGKESFYNSLGMSDSQALEYLRSMLSLTLQTEQAKEGIVAFLEKRKPNWI